MKDIYNPSLRRHAKEFILARLYEPQALEDILEFVDENEVRKAVWVDLLKYGVVAVTSDGKARATGISWAAAILAHNTANQRKH